MIKDTHNPPSDETDPQHEHSRDAALARIRELLASLERGERSSFALVYQLPGRAPRFAYRATGEGYAGNHAASAALLAGVEELRAPLVASCAKARLQWRGQEG